MSLDQLESISS